MGVFPVIDQAEPALAASRHGRLLQLSVFDGVPNPSLSLYLATFRYLLPSEWKKIPDTSAHASIEEIAYDQNGDTVMVIRIAKLIELTSKLFDETRLAA